VPADFGWHSHPAAAAVIVAKGTLTVYDSGDPSCSPHPYSAGQGFIEPANRVHRARNEGKQPVVLYVTYLGLPSGAKSYVPAAKPANCST
jgi:quercetin dioxygenase-like cupin family protein